VCSPCPSECSVVYWFIFRILQYTFPLFTKVTTYANCSPHDTPQPPCFLCRLCPRSGSFVEIDLQYSPRTISLHLCNNLHLDLRLHHDLHHDLPLQLLPTFVSLLPPPPLETSALSSFQRQGSRFPSSLSSVSPSSHPLFLLNATLLARENLPSTRSFSFSLALLFLLPLPLLLLLPLLLVHLVVLAPENAKIFQVLHLDSCHHASKLFEFAHIFASMC